MLAFKLWKKENQNADVTGLFDGHEYVNLGLPSGRLWATCNIGATKSIEHGDFFAWGETKPKNNYTNKDYDIQQFVNSIGNKELDAEHDAATANWGKNWRMPNKKEFKELIDYCFWTWTDNFKLTGATGVVGYSKMNGKMIFSPQPDSGSTTALNTEANMVSTDLPHAKTEETTKLCLFTTKT